VFYTSWHVNRYVILIMKTQIKPVLLKPNVRQPCYRQRVVGLKTHRAERHKPQLTNWQDEWLEHKNEKK